MERGGKAKGSMAGWPPPKVQMLVYPRERKVRGPEATVIKG